ncbi:MAG: M4 family metallopeptidase, partial [Methanosarcinaceae archaeon]
MYKPSSKQKIALDKLRMIDPNFQIKWNEKNGVPMQMRGKLSESMPGDPELISMEFLTIHKNLFKIETPEEELQLKDIGTDVNGNRHVRFQQKYRSIPVFGRETIVHINYDNTVKGVNGKFAPSIDLPEKPEVSAENAKNTILNHDPNNRERTDDAPRLLVLIHEDKPYLTWHMTVNGVDKALDGSETPARWEYFVNALTGKVTWRYNNEQTHTRTTGTGTGKYSGNVTINTVRNHISNKYELEDQWLPTNARIITHDANNGLPPAPTSQDSNNNWSASNQGAEVDCHLYTRIFYDYFLLVHGRDSYDDAGADMNIYAHCNINWNNASWNGSYVKIGDGDGTNNDALCTLDIVAHEWTHAVTEHTAGLIYYGESGALNESFSDVFAALIDGDWLQGEDCWLKATAPAGRNLADPTNGGQYDPANPISSVLDGHQPDHMNDKYTGGSDYGGVHINNSIMNKAAHLIATGGTHRGVTICTDLGRDVLGRLYYHALTQYLISSSDFSDMREAVLDSL